MIDRTRLSSVSDLRMPIKEKKELKVSRVSSIKKRCISDCPSGF